MRIFVTGGSSEMGARMCELLAERSHHVTVASRHPAPRSGVETATLDLANGAGLEAVAGHDTVVHLASNPFALRAVDVGGTRRLLETAAGEGVDHLLAVSIVGIDGHPYPYYQAKLAMEDIVAAGSVPWTILRATQFHDLIPRFVEMVPALGILPVPRNVNIQPIDSGVVAERLADLVEAGPSGRVDDLGGPEVIPLEKMVRDTLAARGLRRLVVPLPLTPRLGTAFRDGRMLTTPTDRGIRWAEYVADLEPLRSS